MKKRAARFRNAKSFNRPAAAVSFHRVLNHLQQTTRDQLLNARVVNKQKIPVVELARLAAYVVKDAAID